jgi:hypothetical protein
MCRGVLLTPAEVGERYRYTDEHLCNLRKAGRGWPFMKLETGGIRYRLSELLAAELRGTTGPLTLERVEQAVAACGDVPLDQRAAMQKHLRAVFGAW